MRRTLFEIDEIPKDLRQYFEEVETKCGAPWKRETGRKCKGCSEFIKTQAKKCPSCGAVNDWKEGRSVSVDMMATDWSTPGKGTPRLPGGFVNKTDAIGWVPTCKCYQGNSVHPIEVDLKPVPCTVLDPFSGAGTTALVAAKMGRDAIGIELNPAYVEMSRKRIVGELGMLADVEVCNA